MTYKIAFDDFIGLQPPFTLRVGRNAGFKGAVLVCGLIALLGVYGLTQDYGVNFTVFLVGLGAFGALASYYYERRAVSKARERYQSGISTAYQRLHCRDNRTFEANQAGFTVKCGCGSLTRPWSELVRFSETKGTFLLSTRTDGHMVPKHAFASEGEITAFRNLLLEQINQDRPFVSRPIEFTYRRTDYLNAYLLHALHGGGWRRLAWLPIQIFGAGYVFLLLFRSEGPVADDPAAPIFAFGGAILIAVAMRLMRRKKQYRGPMRIYFGEAGLHSADSAGVGRQPWTQFIGYLENKHVLLLYLNQRFYRVLPRRAWLGREAEVQASIRAHLPQFDYKDPFRGSRA